MIYVVLGEQNMTNNQSDEYFKIFSWAWKVLAAAATVFIVIASQLVTLTFSLEKYYAAFSLYGIEFISLLPIAILFFVLLRMSSGSTKIVRKAYCTCNTKQKNL